MAEAEDIFQEAHVSVCREALQRQSDGRACLTAWPRCIVINRAFDVHKSRRLGPRLENSLREPGRDDPVSFKSHWALAKLRGWTKGLVMSGPEIAEAKGRREGAVELLKVRACTTSSQWSQGHD